MKTSTERLLQELGIIKIQPNLTRYSIVDVNTITKSEELRSKNISYRRQYDQDTLTRIYRP